MILRRNIEKNELNDIIATCKKTVDLFCIMFKLVLEHDISKDCAKFQRVLYTRFEEFWTEIQVLLLSKLHITLQSCMAYLIILRC